MFSLFIVIDFRHLNGLSFEWMYRKNVMRFISFYGNLGNKCTMGDVHTAK